MGRTAYCAGVDEARWRLKGSIGHLQCHSGPYVASADARCFAGLLAGLSSRELVDASVVIFLSGPQERVREGRLVRRVRPVLCLESDGTVIVESRAVFAGFCAVKILGAVYL